MASTGQKRTRSERVAAIELPPGRWERAWKALHGTGVWLQLLICAIAALLICLVIRGWDPPFSYHVDQTLPRRVFSRVDFSDPDLTQQKRDVARAGARHVYVLDLAPLDQLRDRLRNTVTELTGVESYEALPQGLWDEFLPKSDTAAVLLDQQKRERYERFRQALADDEELKRFEAAIDAALTPLGQRGMLRQLVTDAGSGNPNEIVVYPTGDPAQREVVRVGDVLVGRDVAVRDALRERLGSPDVADSVFCWIRPRLSEVETLRFDRGETERNKDKAADDVPRQFRRADSMEPLAEAGPLELRQVNVLRREYDAINALKRTWWEKASRAGCIVMLVLGLLALCGLHLRFRKPRLTMSVKRQTLLLALIIITLALANWLGTNGRGAEIIPILILGQMIAVGYRREVALLGSGMVILLAALALGHGVGSLILLVGVTTTVILQLDMIRSRSKLIYVGFFGGIAAFALTLVGGVLDDQPIDSVMLTSAALCGVWTLVAGFLMTGLLPFVERLFGVLTDMSLLELSDVSHPLLQELVRRAPSTYNHSLTVGSIAEAAADAVGGRGLLARVGAYFHDIGKILQPDYFIENQPPNDNRHETLYPQMSTLVIFAHIKDGADLARRHKLPTSIIDFIEQHHGTTLVEYFFGRASQQSESDPDGQHVEERTYRYPGPKPQTKEAAVMMLADSAESACRSLVEPGSARIEAVVRDVSERRLKDGQFDESGLTLGELRTIENSVIKSLIANYHGRVKYPNQRTA